MLEASSTAQIVNMSFGATFGSSCVPGVVDDTIAISELSRWTQTLAAPIEEAAALGRDVLWVASAANVGCDNVFTAPANLAGVYNNVMAVAGIDSSGSLWAKAGQASAFGPSISVAAAGEDVYSTSPRHCSLFYFFNCGPYSGADGNSFAAPQVSGLAALALSQDPTLSAADLKTCIVAGAEAGGTAVPGTGFHVINVPAVLEDCAITGTNLLRDPGFELAITSLTNGGPNGNEIPWGASGPVNEYAWPSEGIPNPPTDPGLNFGYYMDALSSADSFPAIVSTANPRSGAYHYRWTIDSSAGFLGGGIYMVGSGSPGSAGPEWETHHPEPPLITGGVSVGDTIDVGSYQMSPAAGITAFGVQHIVAFYEDDGTYISTQVDGFTLQSTYTLTESIFTAPANSAYFDVFIVPVGTTFGQQGSTIDIDDLYVTVTS